MKNKIIFLMIYLFSITHAFAQSNITRIEYYIDNDPGYGLGTNVAITPATVIANLNIPINPASVSQGFHRFNVRAKDALGGWSLCNTTLFFKPSALSGSSASLPNLTKLEYYIDTDPGYGLANDVAITPNTNISNLVISIDPTGLTSGIHVFSVRALDANGAWSLQQSTLMYKPYTLSGTATTLPNITKLEYYFDTDPGYGLATDVAITPNTDISNLVIPIDPTGLTSGIHVFSVRALDANGAWSLQQSTLMYKAYTLSGTATTLPNITKLEYYFDTDPGYGLATDVAITPNTDISNLVIPINPAGLSSGIHVFSVRALDANGAWSLQHSSLIYKPYTLSGTATTLPNIIQLEYYVDTDPGYGVATNVPITSATDIANLVIPINPNNYDIGEHRFAIRALDANGNWSMLNEELFNRFAPAISSTPIPVTGFNADVVADVQNDPYGSTTNSFDANGYVLMSESFNPLGPSFMPTGGIVNSFFRPGLMYQLQPYTADNALKVNYGATDSLTFVTPISTNDIFILGASGNNESVVNITVRYSDMSTEVFPNQVFPIWYDGSDYAIRGVGRTYRYYSAIDNSETEPRLYTLKLSVSAANQSNPIQSISFENVNGGYLNVMAISVGNLCNGIPNPGNTISSVSSACPNTNFTLTLQNPFSGAGTSYAWQSADDVAFTSNVVNLGTSYNQSTTQTSPTYYRCQVTCSYGGSIYSTPVLVNMFTAPNVSISAHIN